MKVKKNIQKNLFGFTVLTLYSVTWKIENEMELDIIMVLSPPYIILPILLAHMWRGLKRVFPIGKDTSSSYIKFIAITCQETER